MNAFSARRLYSDILKKRGEVIFSGQVDPEVNSVQKLNSGLMLPHELETLPLPRVGRRPQVKDNVRVLRRLLVRDETAVKVDGIREVWSQFRVDKDKKLVEELLPVLIPSERRRDVIERAVMHAGRQ